VLQSATAELERRLAAIEARQRAAGAPAAPKPEIWEAPEDFVTEHAKQIVSPLQQEIARIASTTRNGPPSKSTARKR
jgi:hypothetical protein